MKKFLLSLLVVGGFVIYSISQKVNLKAFFSANPFKSPSNISAIVMQGLSVLNKTISPTPSVSPPTGSNNTNNGSFNAIPTLANGLAPAELPKTGTPTLTNITSKTITATKTPTPTIKVIIQTVTTSTPTPAPTRAASTPIQSGSTPTPTPASSAQPTSTPVPTATSTPTPSSGLKNGTFTGSIANALYGNVQVQIVTSGGRMTNCVFLQAPNGSSHSVQINAYADPILCQEAIQAQSANVNIVSGATATSNAFIQSMTTALNLAKA